MHPLATMDNVKWALKNIYSDSDPYRVDARQIIVELGLAEYPEFAENDDSDESNERFRETIRQRARETGYGEYVD